MPDEIPTVEVYGSDKWKFAATIIGAALGPFLTVFMADQGFPQTGWKWAVIVITSLLAVANIIKAQGIPTPQHAAAMRIAGGVMRQIAEADAAPHQTAPERDKTEELRAIVDEATAPKEEVKP